MHACISTDAKVKLKPGKISVKHLCIKACETHSKEKMQLLLCWWM